MLSGAVLGGFIGVQIDLAFGWLDTPYATAVLAVFVGPFVGVFVASRLHVEEDFKALRQRLEESAELFSFMLIFMGLLMLFGVSDTNIQYRTQIVTIGIFLLAAGAWIAKGHLVRWAGADARTRIKTAISGTTVRRIALGAGVVLFVVNILPNYRASVFGGGGGYYWSDWNRGLIGVAVALVLFAILTKPRDERF